MEIVLEVVGVLLIALALVFWTAAARTIHSRWCEKRAADPAALEHAVVKAAYEVVYREEVRITRENYSS